MVASPLQVAKMALLATMRAVAVAFGMALCPALLVGRGGGGVDPWLLDSLTHTWCIVHGQRLSQTKAP